MKLEKLAAIAEIASSAAVVLTLVVLVVELRENTEAVRASNRRAVADRTGALALAVASNAELAAIQAKLLGSQVEYQREASYFIAMSQVVQDSFFLYQDGLLDQSTWLTRAALLRRHLVTDSGRDLYQSIKGAGVMAPEFVQWIDANALEEPAAARQTNPSR
jgi:hypothetical protein